MRSHLLLMLTVRGAYSRLSKSDLTRISLRCWAASLQRFSYSNIQRFWHGLRDLARRALNEEWPSCWFSSPILGKLTSNFFLFRISWDCGSVFCCARCRSWNGAVIRLAVVFLFMVDMWRDTSKLLPPLTLKIGYKFISHQGMLKALCSVFICPRVREITCDVGNGGL